MSTPRIALALALATLAGVAIACSPKAQPGDYLRTVCESVTATLADPSNSDADALAAAHEALDLQPGGPMPKGHPDAKLFLQLAGANVRDALPMQRDYAKAAGLEPVCADWVGIAAARVAALTVSDLPRRPTERGAGFSLVVPDTWRRTDLGVERIAKQFDFVITKLQRSSKDAPDAWAIVELDAEPSDCAAYMHQTGAALGYGSPLRIGREPCEADFGFGRHDGARIRIRNNPDTRRVTGSLCQWSRPRENDKYLRRCKKFSREVVWDDAPKHKSPPVPTVNNTCTKDADCGLIGRELHGPEYCCETCAPNAANKKWIKRFEGFCRTKAQRPTACSEHQCGEHSITHAQCVAGACQPAR